MGDVCVDIQSDQRSFWKFLLDRYGVVKHLLTGSGVGTKGEDQTQSVVKTVWFFDISCWSEKRHGEKHC